jgi:hypothetical protein
MCGILRFILPVHWSAVIEEKTMAKQRASSSIAGLLIMDSRR